MSYYINPNAILDNSIKQSSLPVKVQEKVDLYHINKQKPVIVGRAISANSEEGSKYYFADGILKVKTRSNTLGFYYIEIRIGGIIFTIPKKNTQDYIDLCGALVSLFNGNFSSQAINNIAIGSTVLGEFPILNTCIKAINTYTSLTRSPYVTINNGELVVDKPLIYNFNSGKVLSITPKPMYYRYKNNKSKQNHLESPAFDGLTWGDHRKRLSGTYYLYKYTYRKKTTRGLVKRRGYYKAASIWRRYKISKNNIIYFKIMNHAHKNHINICSKLNDKYKG